MAKFEFLSEHAGAQSGQKGPRMLRQIFKIGRSIQGQNYKFSKMCRSILKQKSARRAQDAPAFFLNSPGHPGAKNCKFQNLRGHLETIIGQQGPRIIQQLFNIAKGYDAKK